MHNPNSLSLRKRSNKSAAVFSLIVVILGIWKIGDQVSDAFLFGASIYGVVWGTLRCLGFGESKWQNGVMILLLMLFYQGFFRLGTASSLGNFGQEWLSIMTFFSIAMLWVFFVVWLKEHEERREQSR